MACKYGAPIRQLTRHSQAASPVASSINKCITLSLRPSRNSSTSTQSSHQSQISTVPPSLITEATIAATSLSRNPRAKRPQPPQDPHTHAYSPRYSPNRAPSSPIQSNAPIPRRRAHQPLKYSDLPPRPTLSQSLREHLPILRAQKPHYITIHIHGKPYLVTAGDTIRLPFLMHGVSPGDILRLNKATILGSRDWTLKAGVRNPPSEGGYVRDAASGQLQSSIAQEPIVGKTDDILNEAYPVTSSSLGIGGEEQGQQQQAGTVNNLQGQVDGRGQEVQADAKRYQLRKKQASGYLDDRLFVCRATVLGTESEPMTFHEKTKPRRRKVRTMKSKLRFTIIRVTEVQVRTVEEIESAVEAGVQDGQVIEDGNEA